MGGGGQAGAHLLVCAPCHERPLDIHPPSSYTHPPPTNITNTRLAAMCCHCLFWRRPVGLVGAYDMVGCACRPYLLVDYTPETLQARLEAMR